MDVTRSGLFFGGIAGQHSLREPHGTIHQLLGQDATKQVFAIQSFVEVARIKHHRLNQFWWFEFESILICSRVHHGSSSIRRIKFEKTTTFCERFCLTKKIRLCQDRWQPHHQEALGEYGSVPSWVPSWGGMFDGNSRILRWRYVNVPFFRP